MKCNKAGSTMKIVTFIVLKDISELFYTFGDAKNQAGSDDLIDMIFLRGSWETAINS